MISAWKAEFAKARSGSQDFLGLSDSTLTEWRADLQKAEGDERTTLLWELEDRAERLTKRHPAAKEAVVQIVRGESEALDIRLEEWLSKLDNEEKTISMKRSDVLRLKERFKYTHEVNRGDVRKWAHHLQHEDGLSAATVRRVISACSGYWRYLQLQGVVSDDTEPFRDVVAGSKGKSKSDVAKVRKPFAPSDVVKLLKRAETPMTISFGT